MGDQHAATRGIGGRRRDNKPRTRPRQLEEGEHSVDRSQTSTITLAGREVKVLYWAVHPHGWARPQRRRTQAPPDTPDKVLRARATAHAEEILRTHGEALTQTRTMSVGQYVKEVVEPVIMGNPRLSAASVRQYKRVLRLLLGECEGDHSHRFTIAPLKFQSVTVFRRVLDCLQEIAKFHGEESAHQARTVLSGYVFQQMAYDNLIDRDPILNRRIDLSSMAREKKIGRKGGVALSRSQYHKVLNWLLAFDPAEAPTAISAPHWRRDAVVARLGRVRDLTLVQMSTGLRIEEALGLPIRSAQVDKEGAVRLTISGKGGYLRIASSWCDPALPVFKRLLSNVKPNDYLIGSPNDRSKPWDNRNAGRSVEELYLLMRETLKIEAFKHERSHVWRATLNTLLVDVLSPEKRAAQFGHSTRINKKSYLDLALTETEIGMARRALGLGRTQS